MGATGCPACCPSTEGLAFGLALHVSALLCWGASYLLLRLLRA